MTMEDVMSGVKSGHLKKPNDYGRMQFRIDKGSKQFISKGISSLLLELKKVPDFKGFRRNDTLISCIVLGMSNLQTMLKDQNIKDKDLQRLAKLIHSRKTQFALSKKEAN